MKSREGREERVKSREARAYFQFVRVYRIFLLEFHVLFSIQHQPGASRATMARRCGAANQ